MANIGLKKMSSMESEIMEQPEILEHIMEIISIMLLKIKKVGGFNENE